MDFLSISNNQLNNINLYDEVSKIKSDEYQKYFLSDSGLEHYRLLSYLSIKNESVNFLDVGTLKGCSALAFSHNRKNKVYSFNVVEELDLLDPPSNIEFIVNDILNDQFNDIIISSKYIMLDTFHDGIFEKEFLNKLILLKYKGFLLLDDIFLNEEMRVFWESINLKKYNITNIGHVTGTGVVYFE